MYAAATDEEVVQAATDLASDRFIGYSTWKWADLHGKTGGKPVYRYLYARPRPAMACRTAGWRASRSRPPPPREARCIPPKSSMRWATSLSKVYAWTPDDHKVSEVMQGISPTSSRPAIRTGRACRSGRRPTPEPRHRSCGLMSTLAPRLIPRVSAICSSTRSTTSRRNRLAGSNHEIVSRRRNCNHHVRVVYGNVPEVTRNLAGTCIAPRREMRTDGRAAALAITLLILIAQPTPLSAQQAQLPAPEAWAALDRGDAEKAAAIFREELERSPRMPRCIMAPATRRSRSAAPMRRSRR